MAFAQYKFTLNHATKGQEVVSLVDGWKDLELILERDEDFHSLVELVETPLIFYGDARLYILDVIDTYGIDEEVSITIDISTDEGASYTEIFEGTLSLEEVEEVFEGEDSYRVKVPILPNGFWQKFINRIDTPIELGTTTSIDGDTTETINSHSVTLSGQTVDQEYHVEMNADDSTIGSFSPNAYFYIDSYYNLIKDEVEDVYNIGTGNSSNLDVWKIEFKLGGTFWIENSFAISYVAGGTAPNPDFYLKVTNGGTAIKYTKTSLGLTPPNFAHNYYINTLVSVNPGDIVYLYGYNNSAGGGSVVTVLEDADNASPPTKSFLRIIHHSTFASSTASTFKLHEAGNSIINNMLGENGTLYSHILGNTSTQIRASDYTSDSDISYYAITRGLQLRTKTLTEKPIFISFKEYWKGIKPIFNLGLGYEADPNVPTDNVIRIEDIEHFYNNDPHSTLSNIENLVREIDSQLFYKLIQVGFEKWKSDSSGAIDDPQTKHSYSLRFKTFGKDLKLLSQFIAAGLAIEITRRQQIEDAEDWRLDNDTFIISLDSSSDSNPRLFDSSPNGISGVKFSGDRYNLDLTPKRSLLRNMNWLSAGLTKYASSEYKFQGGEGNFDMCSTLSDGSRGDYNGNEICENSDVAWDYGGSPLKTEQNPLFVPEIYSFEYPLTFDEYQDFVSDANRKRSISISSGTTNYFNVFILRMAYNPSTGIAKFKVIKAYT